MKILILGHQIKTEKILSVINKYEDAEMKTYFIHTKAGILDQMDEVSKLIKWSDITLVSGEITYRWISEKLILSSKVVYIPKTDEMLYRALLDCKLNGYDILNVSIDSYAYEGIVEVYKELKLEEGKLDIYCQTYDVLSDYYCEEVAKKHLKSYLAGQVTCCMTAVSDVYEILLEKKIPCILINATERVIRDALEKAKQQLLLEESKGNDLVFLVIDTQIPDESLTNENDFRLVLERLDLAKQIYNFSQMISAAVEEINLRRYVLVTKYRNLMEETHNLQDIKLFDLVNSNTVSSVSLGIGLGETAREARHHAQMGLRKARKKDVCCAYVVYSNEKVQGPIYHAKSGSDELKLDEHFNRIAEASGLSLNMIFKLNTIIRKNEKDIYTINEMAKLCEVSIRSMYRIVDKLMEAGYVTELGKKMVGDTGRPSRIYKYTLNAR